MTVLDYAQIHNSLKIPGVLNYGVLHCGCRKYARNSTMKLHRFVINVTIVYFSFVNRMITK